MPDRFVEEPATLAEAVRQIEHYRAFLVTISKQGDEISATLAEKALQGDEP